MYTKAIHGFFKRVYIPDSTCTVSTTSCATQWDPKASDSERYGAFSTAYRQRHAHQPDRPHPPYLAVLHKSSNPSSTTDYLVYVALTLGYLSTGSKGRSGEPPSALVPFFLFFFLLFFLARLLPFTEDGSAILVVNTMLDNLWSRKSFAKTVFSTNKRRVFHRPDRHFCCCAKGMRAPFTCPYSPTHGRFSPCDYHMMPWDRVTPMHDSACSKV